MNRCRLCLDGCNELGGTSIKDSEFRLIIIAVFSCTIIEEHGLPEHVCSKCFSTVTDFYKYSNQVKANQELLKQTGSGIECVWIEGALGDKTEVREIKVEPTDPNFEGNAGLIESTLSSAISTSDGVSSDGVECLYPKKGFGEAGSSIHSIEDERTTVAMPGANGIAISVVSEVTIEFTDTIESANFVETNDENYSEPGTHEEEEIYNPEPSILMPHTYSEETLADNLLQQPAYTHDEYGRSSCDTEKLQNQYQRANARRYRCKLCLTSYKFKQSLTRHNAKQHPSASTLPQQRYHTRNRCNTSDDNSRSLQKHTRYHERIGDKFKACPVCGKRVSGIYFKAHLEAHTSNCPINVTEHKVTEKTNTIGGDQCDKSFTTSRKLDLHQILHQQKNCPVCGKTVRLNHFKLHLQWHNPDGSRYSCDLCNLSYKYRNSLVLHNSVKHTASVKQTAQKKSKKRKRESRSYVCEQCGGSFYTQGELTAHTFYHVRKPCSVCGKSVPVKHMTRHLSGHDPDAPRFRCEQCNTSYKSREILASHNALKHPPVDSSSPKQPYVCEQCNRSFWGEKMFRKHQYYHKRMSRKKECPVCHKLVAESYHGTHVKNHTSAPKFRCQLCNIWYRCGKSLKVHNAVNHASDASLSEIRSHFCEQCGESFSNEILFKRHKLTHDQKECTVCGKTVRVSQFKAHMQGHAPCPTTIRCDVCNIALKTEKNLRLHNALKHTPDDLKQSYACDKCDDKFGNRVQLTLHRHKHKKKKCPVCEKLFSSSALKAHLTVHSIDAPRYSCALCNTSYKFKQGLRLHNTVKHTPAKDSELQSHACAQCSRTFSSQQQLKIHQYNHRRSGKKKA